MSLIPSIISSDSGGRNNGEFKGSWDALTNTPTLTNPPTTANYNIGDYYRVTVAGSQFGFNFEVGDKLIVVSAGPGALAWDQDGNIPVPIGIDDGGTGATNATGARSNLGIGSVGTLNSLDNQIHTTNLIDVDTTAPTNNQVLQYNSTSSKFEPVTLPADAGGTVTSINVSGSNGISFTGGPVTNSGTIAGTLDNTAVSAGAYTNADITVDAQGRITAASNGSSGGSGDVTGPSSSTNENIAIFDGTTGKIIKDGSTNISTINSAIAANTSDIALKANLNSPTLTGLPIAPTPSAGDNSTRLATTAYTDNAVSSISLATTGLSDVSSTSPSNNQVLQFNSTSGDYEPVTLPADAGGTVTSITAGVGLDGGTITGSGTIDLADTAVSAGSYTNSDITIDAQGRITSASNGASGGTGDVTGPSSSTDSNVALFDGATGKIIKDGGALGSLASQNTIANSDIDNGAVNLSKLDSALQASMSDIAVNTSNISTNTTDIATNTAIIATNTSDISANGSDIATLQTDVTTNTTNIALKANIASPALTGTPTAPTPSSNDNSTKIATTAYVDGQVSPNNKGVFASASALRTAYPTGQSGWYAIVTTTDTFWIWDTGTTDWVDTNTNSGGDVTGPSSSTSANMVSFDGVTGKLIQDSGVASSDISNAISQTNTNTSDIATNTTAIATKITASSTDTLTNKSIDADNNTLSNIEVDNFKASAIVTESEGIASNDNDTTLPTSAAVKDYVDSTAGGTGTVTSVDVSAGTGISSSGGPVTSNGSITVGLDTATQNTLADVANKAPIASPAFTGTPTAPTQSAADNSTKIATTAYVDSATATRDQLSELTDVTIASIADADYLIYDATSAVWENQTISGAISSDKEGVTTLASGIDAAKISAGNVSNTEFDYLNGVTSSIQAQIDANMGNISANTVNISSNSTAIAGKISASSTDTLTNKSIDADDNTLSNIENDNIKAGAAIDATKLADGTVSNTELQYINSVTSNVQDQIDAKGSGTVTSITAGTGLDGGAITGSGTIDLADTSVSAGSFTNADITVDAQGRITAASNGTGGGTGTVTSIDVTAGTGISSSGGPVTSSGSITVALDSATQTTLAQVSTNTSNISSNTTAIAGKANSGSNSDITALTGLTTALSVAQGGTGATTASAARTSLGLGSLATQSSVTDTDIAAGVNADKISSGSVSNTEFDYLNGVTSAIQTQIDAKAPLASPALTGTPTAPTASSSDNSTKIATTAYADNAVSNISLATTGLSDVSATAPTNQQVLRFNSTSGEYEPATISSGGSGDVTGPSSSTNNNVAAFDGATGKIIKDSGKVLDDIGRVILQRFTSSGTGNITAPSDAIAARIVAYGGGGGGAGAGYSFFDGTVDSYVGGGGGGGASGEKKEIYLSVSGGSTAFYYNIGTGGTAGTGQSVSSNAGDGGYGNSTTLGIDSTLTRLLLTASGGSGGYAPTGSGSGALPDGGAGGGGMSDFGGGGGNRGSDGFSNGNFGTGGMGDVMSGETATSSGGGAGGYQTSNGGNEGGGGGGVGGGSGGTNGTGSSGTLASGGGGGSGGNSSGSLANGRAGGAGGDGYISIEWQY